MDQVIKSDLFRYGGLRKISKGKKIPGFHYMYRFRKASKHKKMSFAGIYYRLIVRRLSYKYGFQIPVNPSIGEGFFIGHFGVIVINGKLKSEKIAIKLIL